MSQIFDALNQSATERGGQGARDYSAAKELLQVVERKASRFHSAGRAAVTAKRRRPMPRECFLP